MQADTASPGTTGGNREDLRDDITILEPQETPFTSMVEKRGTSSAMFVETLSDRFRAVRTTGFPEGKAGGKGNNQSKDRARFGVYHHKSMDEWAVTKEQKIIAQRGGQAGITNMEDHEKARTTLQVKRDMEAVNCSDLETQDGAGGTAAMQTRGAFKWIGTSHTPSVDANFLPVSGDPDSTNSVILAHGNTAPQLFTENKFENVGKNLQKVHGSKKSFTMIAGDNVVQTVDRFTRIQANSTSTHHNVTNVNTTHEITLMVNIYESSFFRVDVVPTQFNKVSSGAGDANAALILFMDLWYLDMLEELNEAEYWENAGGCGGVVQASWVNMCKSPRGNGKLVTS